MKMRKCERNSNQFNNIGKIVNWGQLSLETHIQELVRNQDKVVLSQCRIKPMSVLASCMYVTGVLAGAGEKSEQL